MSVQDMAVDFGPFLRDYYHEDVLALADAGDESLTVEYADIVQWNASTADLIEYSPRETLPLLDDALREYTLPVDVDLSNARVRVTDTREVLPRVSVSDIRSRHFGRYLGVVGTIGQTTPVKGRYVEKAYRDARCEHVEVVRAYNLNEPSAPTTCPACQKQGAWVHDRARTVQVNNVQLKLEPPAGVGGRSGSLFVNVDGDLVEIDGGLPNHAGKQSVVFGTLADRGGKTHTDPYLDARAITFASHAAIDVDDHLDRIERLAAGEEGDPVELLTRSIDPSLYLTDELKTVATAGVAWLFNGYPWRDGVRGDFHMMVLGDPGTGKSSLCSALHDIAPKSEYRSAGGLTEVGLTAAAVQEEFNGETHWVIEPGVLPRANGGHCLIDEVDAITSEKTKAIHDALEGEQLVKVDKANVSADLPSRTAFLGVGNPVEGRYDPTIPFAEQLGIGAALADRMDVLLVLHDPDDDDHRRIRDHVAAGLLGAAEATKPPIDRETVRAWVHHARESVRPELTAEATAVITDFYDELLGINDPDGPVATTPRKLASGARLAIAFARIELSDTVEAHHAERAVGILRASMYVTHDPFTGQFDAGFVDTGRPKSQGDRRDAVREAIIELDDGEGAERDAVVETVTESGVDADLVDDDIKFFKRNGSVYEPGVGRLAWTG